MGVVIHSIFVNVDLPMERGHNIVQQIKEIVWKEKKRYHVVAITNEQGNGYRLEALKSGSNFCIQGLFKAQTVLEIL